jgi:hypothetical protein
MDSHPQSCGGFSLRRRKGDVAPASRTARCALFYEGSKQVLATLRSFVRHRRLRSHERAVRTAIQRRATSEDAGNGIWRLNPESAATATYNTYDDTARFKV